MGALQADHVLVGNRVFPMALGPGTTEPKPADTPAEEDVSLTKSYAGSSTPAGKYDTFLTHNWGEDDEGRNNHERVKAVHSKLRDLGVCCWFDEEQLEGEIDKKMADGIDDSASVVVFITKKYMSKVNTEGPDNCKKEFLYATKKGKKLIPVLMEVAVQDTSQWSGPVGLNLSTHLYVDMSTDQLINDSISQLKGRILGP